MLSKLTANGQPWEFGGLNNSLHCCTHIYFISFKERLLQCPAVESRLADLTEDHNKQKTEMYWLDRGSQMLFVQIWAKFEYTVKKIKNLSSTFPTNQAAKLFPSSLRSLGRIWLLLKSSAQGLSHNHLRQWIRLLFTSVGHQIRFFLWWTCRLCLCFSHVKWNCGNNIALLTL